MKGQLLKTNDGWFVLFPQQSRISVYNGGSINQDSVGMLKLHPNTQTDRLIDGTEVEYEVVTKYIEPDDSIHCNRGSDVDFAKIVDEKDNQNL